MHTTKQKKEMSMRIWSAITLYWIISFFTAKPFANHLYLFTDIRIHISNRLQFIVVRLLNMLYSHNIMVWKKHMLQMHIVLI